MTTDQTRHVPLSSIVALTDIAGVTWLTDGYWAARVDLVPFAHALAESCSMHTPGAYRLGVDGAEPLPGEADRAGKQIADALAQPRVEQWGQLDIAGTIQYTTLREIECRRIEFRYLHGYRTAGAQ